MRMGRLPVAARVIKSKIGSPPEKEESLPSKGLPNDDNNMHTTPLRKWENFCFGVPLRRVGKEVKRASHLRSCSGEALFLVKTVILRKRNSNKKIIISA